MSDQAQTRVSVQTDPILRTMATKIVNADEKSFVPITLLLGDGTVSGDLVSMWRWTREMSALLREDGEGRGAEALAGFFDAITDSPGEPVMDEKVLPSLYLVNARCWTRGLKGEEVGPVVINLAQVSGWFLGSV